MPPPLESSAVGPPPPRPLLPQQIDSILFERFGQRLTARLPLEKRARVHVAAVDWQELASVLHDDPRLQFDWLANLAGLHYPAERQLAVVCDFASTRLGHRFGVKVICDEATPQLPSISHLWPAANWQEREAYDMYGIDFVGHPNLKRILLAEDWVGHPLRKDYVFPREYHGIPGSVELDWQQKPGSAKK